MEDFNRRTMMQLADGASLTAFGGDAALALPRSVSTAERLALLAPRMTAAGVPTSDIDAIRQANPEPGRWTAAWNALGDRHRAAAGALFSDGQLRPAGEAYQRAALAYHFGRLVQADSEADTARAVAMSARSGADALDLLDPAKALPGGANRPAARHLSIDGGRLSIGHA